MSIRRLVLTVVSTLALALLFAPALEAVPAYANPTVTWGGSTTITEGDSATAINSEGIAISGNSFDSGFLDFSVGSQAATDVLSFATVGTPDTESGNVSIVGTSVYLGNGTTADNIGSIDATKNGSGGQALRVNFVNSFPNASFEADANNASPTGWTIANYQVILGSTVLGGYTSVDGRDYSGMPCVGDNDDGIYNVNAPNGTYSSNFTTKTFQANVTTSTFTDGQKSLRLYMSVQGGNSNGWVIHGPAAVSSNFQASANDVISFDWKAIGGGDDYSVYGYIVRVDAGDPGRQYKILDAYERRDGDKSNFSTVNFTIPASGTYKFVFVGGAHNYDNGSCSGVQGDSQLFIDNVVVVGDKATAAVAQKVAQLVRYANTSDAPPASRTITLTAQDGAGNSNTATTTVNITAVNDAPSIDGDGSTTAIARTVTEQDADSVDNPIADVTGTLSGYDPDLNSPTYTFGIQGGTVSGSSVTKVGTYGTLTVNSSSGAYTYVPNMAAIKPLDTGDDPVDGFTLSVSDGSLAGSGTLNFTIDSITDTEPSAPTITAVVGGDTFLTVLFDPPGSAGGNPISDYEYSLDGGSFVSLNTVPTGGFTISSLTNGTSYSVRIRADNGQASPVSNSVSGTPSATPAISQPSIQSFEPSVSLTAISNDFVVSGFGPSDNLLVSIGLTGQAANTQFALPNFEDSGATEGSGYSSYSDGTAVNDFAMTGSQTEVNAALKGLKLKTGTTRSNFSVNVSASVVSGSILQSGSTQSFYEYVSAANISWSDAVTAAAGRTFAGVNGYLVTITSPEENAFVAARIPNASDVWIGASDATTEGDWRWVTGPEGANGGTRFWYSSSGVVGGVGLTTDYYPDNRTRSCTATGATPVGSLDSNLVTYACWASGEPNNSFPSYSGEDAAVTNWNGGSGLWNDLPGAYTTSIQGYVVEYSEWNGQTFSSTSVVKTSSSVSMGGPVLSATAGAQSASLSWTVPIRTGQTVSSYAVTSVPSVAGVSACAGTASSCTVSGLTAGTEYTFTVTATWSDSATSASNSVAVRALAASSGGGGGSGGSGGGGSPSAGPTTSPVPSVTRITPRPPLVPVIQQGPVLRGNVPPPPPIAPTATVGGRPASLQTQVTSPTGFSLTAGVLNLGLQVQQDQGLVRQNASGGTEIEVRKGSTAAVSGSGLTPRSTVQVFLPLQGANAKEIARIPVDETGSFNGEAIFATRANERPLPIGKQVLQVVSLDEDGNQAVVEMTVNIAQPPPAPEPDRTVGQRPTLLPGQFLATNAGEPEVVTVIPVPDVKQARVEGDGWQMAVDIPSANGAVSASDEGGALLQLVRDETAVVSGSGFMPGTRADVWLFSDPTLLGTVDIDENGEFSGEVAIDANMVVVGEHTLQLQGVGEDGYVRAANLGVVVSDAGPEATTEESASGFLWWWILLLLAVLLMLFAVWRYRRRRRA